MFYLTVKPWGTDIERRDSKSETVILGGDSHQSSIKGVFI